MAEKDMEGSEWLAEVRANIDELYTKTLTTPPASDAEALAKSATDKALTPANLAAIGSTTTFAGLVELATSAETITGTDTARAVTPKGLADKLADTFKTGTHTVTGGEGSAHTLDITTGLTTATGFIVQVYRSGVMVLADAAVSMAAGVITLADGAATYDVTSGDVVNWIVF